MCLNWILLFCFVFESLVPRVHCVCLYVCFMFIRHAVNAKSSTEVIASTCKQKSCVSFVPEFEPNKIEIHSRFFVHWKTPCHLLVLFSPNKIMKRRGGMIKKKSNCKEEPNWWQGIISIFFPAE